MWIDLLALSACLAGVWLGWRRGVRAMLPALLALVVGYGAALTLNGWAGGIVDAVTPVPAMASRLVGGAVVFLLVSFVASTGTRRWLSGGRRGAPRRERAPSGPKEAASSGGFDGVDGAALPTPLDKTGGALVGGLGAAVLVAVVAWAGTALSSLGVLAGDAGSAVEASPAPSIPSPDAPAGATEEIERSASERRGGDAGPEPVRDATAEGDRSLTTRLAEALTERAVETALRVTGEDPSVSRTTAAAVARPARTREAVATLTDPERLRPLTEDPEVRRALAAGDVRGVVSDPTFHRWLADPATARALRTLRLVEGGDLPPEELARQLARQAGPAAAAVAELREDPEIQAELRRSRLRERIRRGELAGLADDPDVLWIVQRARAVLAEKRAASEGSDTMR